jgi:uncharacterized membrane protein YhaH (DUF805 family)
MGLSMLIIAVVSALIVFCLGGEIRIDTIVFLRIIFSLVLIFVFLIFTMICLRLIKPAVPPYTEVIRKEELE